MSWSVQLIGSLAKINERLDSYGATLTGPSKDEFDAAKPHLQALVAENFSPVVKLVAAGHAYIDGEGKKTQGNCQVSLEPFYMELVG